MAKLRTIRAGSCRDSHTFMRHYAALDTRLRGWQFHLQKLARWQQKGNKPVVFTKVGYKTAPDAAARQMVRALELAALVTS